MAEATDSLHQAQLRTTLAIATHTRALQVGDWAIGRGGANRKKSARPWEADLRNAGR
jgi:hypothetical protein